MVCACFSHLCLSPSQGFHAAWGNRSLSSFIFRIFAVWNILDCVGSLHAVVPSCETTNSAPAPGCHQGKHCETYVIAVLMGWCVTPPSNIATLVRFVMWPQKQSNSYMSLLTPYCDIFFLSLLKDYTKRGEKQKLHLADTLLDLLSVLVEFWCQQHFKLNQNLVEKGLNDLSEHFAIISQGMKNGKIE